MLATAEVAGVVADFLDAWTSLPVPSSSIPFCAPLPEPSSSTLWSSCSSGSASPAGPRGHPQSREAALLTGNSGEDAEAMARALRQLGAAAAVVTGGDAHGCEDFPADSTEDVLAYAAGGMELSRPCPLPGSIPILPMAPVARSLRPLPADLPGDRMSPRLSLQQRPLSAEPSKWHPALAAAKDLWT